MFHASRRSLTQHIESAAPHKHRHPAPPKKVSFNQNHLKLKTSYTSLLLPPPSLSSRETSTMAQSRQTNLEGMAKWADNTTDLAKEVDLENHDTKLPVRSEALSIIQSACSVLRLSQFTGSHR